MNAALILSGGSGQRFQSALPKQYHKILGKMVIEYAIEAAMNAKSIDTIVIAAHPSKAVKRLQTLYPSVVFVPAGEKRNETLKNGLMYLNEAACERVIIMDAVRPLVTGELIDTYIRLISEGYHAVTTAQAITDSLGCLDMHAVDRSRYYLMQSPESYDFPLLYAHFDSESPLTEVAQQLPEEIRLMKYYDFPENLKLTYPWEKQYIASLLRKRRNRN
ncbi:MAG: 2-C-methyl-D-erythritol 4-phosphate cytidylyltransferase [Clostridia bacterium]|nr:2-C-methyl-D-erythritol 4-phosphate cytidylyltransferase [Clostridia bacterium]